MGGEPARVALIAGNWKMNFDHLQAIAFTQKLAAILQEAGHDYAEVEVALCPPFTALRSVENVVVGEKLPFSYGAQDLSEHDEGAYTGQISGRFLHKLGCRYVLVGHSERREYQQESDELIHAKLLAARRHNLVPILCVGEPLPVREAGQHCEVVVGQLEAALRGEGSTLSAEDVSSLVVAYEPVWAIGTGAVASAEDAGQMATAIRHRIGQLWGQEAAQQVRILYGGSVKAQTIAGIMQQGDVDGALVGGASLDAEEFARIIRFRSHVVTTLT